MSERFERQSDQHAINGTTESDPGTAAVRRRRPGVGAEVGGGRVRVSGGHRSAALRCGRRPVAEEAEGR